MTHHRSVRIWDLPTRLFHWTLAASVIALVVTAKMGGNAMEWHLRLGHLVLALLAFRMVWGVIGGRWSRFTAFVYSPARVWAYLRGQSRPEEKAGHSPLGALSVWAMLAALLAQVGSGLVSDDEIAFAGSLSRYVSQATVAQATTYHKEIGQYLIMGLVALHLVAIAYYTLARRQPLVRAMFSGDKPLSTPVPPTHDGVGRRLLGAAVLVLCIVASWWLSTLASAAF